MAQIGHNKGPTMEGGAGWRRYAWGRARRELLPRLPIEVVRLRIRRARELGIDYKSYASIRAGTGRDIVALLFSANALSIGPRRVTIPAAKAGKLTLINRCDQLAMLYAPASIQEFMTENQWFTDAAQAPDLRNSWRDVGRMVTDLPTRHNLPGPGVVVVGDTALEREWADAGRLGGFLPPQALFASP